jgi:pimeloyl-ACP methyl ester carboxylesterase
VLWGTSLGGAHVVVQAAKDQRIAAVIAQVPFNSFPKTVEGRSGQKTRRLLWAMVWDWLRGLTGLAPAYIPAVGRPGELAVMASDTAAEAIEALAGTGTSWQNKVAPRVLLEMMFHKPSNYAPQVSCPLLVSMAENDSETPPDLARPLADKAPRGEMRSYAIRHFQIYKQEIRRAVITDQIGFLGARVDMAGLIPSPPPLSWRR